MTLPPNHPQRFELNNEVHARPSEALSSPLRVSYVALFGARREDEIEPVRALARQYGAPQPEPGTSHYSAHFGQFRLRWERHTEFSRYMFIVPGVGPSPFDDPAIAQIPDDIVAGLPGETIAAAHAVLVRQGDHPADYEEVAKRHFGSNVMVGSLISGGAGLALTDFRIHADGFSRFWIEDRSMTPFQAGRIVQRLLEIETYRMMALLALPVARELAPFLRSSETELAEITHAIADAASEDEPILLNRLTRLEALIEGRNVENQYRFSAARAYYDLVHQRIEELREERIQGLQTLREFTERRLAPAMATCESVARRQEVLSERVARATQLLSTRVDVTRSRQNQDLLASMNRRAKMQLRLQETVEGLSVAAVAYYIVGLVGYLAKGLKSTGLPVDPDLAMGASLPFILVLTLLGVGRVRKMLVKKKPKTTDAAPEAR